MIFSDDEKNLSEPSNSKRIYDCLVSSIICAPYLNVSYINVQPRGQDG